MDIEINLKYDCDGECVRFRTESVVGVEKDNVHYFALLCIALREANVLTSLGHACLFRVIASGFSKIASASLAHGIVHSLQLCGQIQETAMLFRNATRN